MIQDMESAICLTDSSTSRPTSKLIDYTKARRPTNQENTSKLAPSSLHIDPHPTPSLRKTKIKNTDYIRSLLQQSISNSSECSGKSDERVEFLMKVPRGSEERAKARKASSEDLRYFLSQQSKHHRQRDTRTSRPPNAA